MADSLFLYLNNRCTVFFFIAASNKQKTTGVGEGKPLKGSNLTPLVRKGPILFNIITYQEEVKE